MNPVTTQQQFDPQYATPTQGICYVNSGFWIGDFGLLIPEFARPPAIGSVALFPRIDISPGRESAEP